MKISDEELAQLQKLLADADKVYLESDKCHWQTSKRVSPEATAAALQELQQLRADLAWKSVSDGINNDLDLFLINMDGTDDLSTVHAALRIGDQFKIDGVYCPREDVYFGQWGLRDILEEHPNATWREIVKETTNEN